MGNLGRARQPQQPPLPPQRLVWLENEFAIYAIAQSSTRWLADCPYRRFSHSLDMAYVTAWPMRLHWSVWWMKASRPVPTTPADLARALDRQPPRDPADRSVGFLIDAEDKMVARLGDPRVADPGPILPAGTRIVAGRFLFDACSPISLGWDYQLATVASGPWADTPVDLIVGRAGEDCLIARLGIVPEDEPIASDRDAAHALLQRLRDVKRQSPS